MRALQNPLKDGLVVAILIWHQDDLMMYLMGTSWNGSVCMKGNQAGMYLVATAFPGSIEEYATPLEAFDTLETEQDGAMMDMSEDAIQQETELDGVAIPSLPIKEAERRAGWRRLPQKVRIVILRFHRQFGHGPQQFLC